MNKLIQYIKDSREELKKVTWPTKKQTLNYSVAVIAISVLIAAYIAVLDFGMSKGVEYIIEKAPAAPASEIVPTTEPIQLNPGDIQVEGGDVTVQPVPVEPAQ